jgi:ribosomal protein S18 acetylase RimI-like enzyme
VIDVALRLAGLDDAAFLLDVYARTRTEELAPVPWTDEQKHDFLSQQFHAQDTAYRETYPDASFMVIELAGTPIGRLYTTRLDGNELRIIDIALLPEHRNTGIGTKVIRMILADADRDGLVVSLHVELWNPALLLYERLGFRRAGANEVYVRMERAAS